jgi:hypothetical protein
MLVISRISSVFFAFNDVEADLGIDIEFFEIVTMF